MNRAYLTFVDDHGKLHTYTFINWHMTELPIEKQKHIVLTASALPIKMTHSVTEWPFHMRNLERFINGDIDQLPRVAPELPEDFS